MATGRAPPTADRGPSPKAWHHSPTRALSHLHPARNNATGDAYAHDSRSCAGHVVHDRGSVFQSVIVRNLRIPYLVHVPCFTSFGVKSRSRPTAAHSGLLQIGDREFHSHRPSFPPLVGSFLACVKSESGSARAKALRPQQLHGVPIMIAVRRLQTRDLRRRARSDAAARVPHFGNRRFEALVRLANRSACSERYGSRQ